MAIRNNIQSAIGQIINKKWYACYSFLAVAEWFENTPYNGFSKLLLKNAEIEQWHAKQFSNYLKQRTGTGNEISIKAPKSDFKSAPEAFDYILDQKKDISKNERKLYALASKGKDYKTIEFLLQLFQEMVPKKKNSQHFTSKITFVKDNMTTGLHLNYKTKTKYTMASN